MKMSLFKNLSILILGVCLVLVKTDTSEAIYEEKYSQIIWSYLEKLCALGPRNPGSKGYIKTIELIHREPLRCLIETRAFSPGIRSGVTKTKS